MPVNLANLLIYPPPHLLVRLVPTMMWWARRCFRFRRSIGEESVRRATGSPPGSAEHARLISESGDRLLRLLSDILDFSKIEAEQLALETHAFELRAMLADTVSLVEPKAIAGSVRIISNYGTQADISTIRR